MRHGVSRADVLSVVACSAVVGCLGVSMTIAEPSGRGVRLWESLADLRAIGSGMGQYRADSPTAVTAAADGRATGWDGGTRLADARGSEKDWGMGERICNRPSIRRE